jgi:hypothetical protein
MFKQIKNYLAIVVLGGLCIINPAKAFDLTVTNLTGEAIAIDPYGVPFGSMVKEALGKDGKNVFGKVLWKIDKSRSNVTYDNAGTIPLKEFKKAFPKFDMNKPVVPAGWTGVLTFHDIDIGVCFDLANFKIGLESGDFSMQSRLTQYVDSKAYQGTMDALKGVGEALGNINEDFAEVDNPDIKTATAALATAGKMWPGVVDVVKDTACRNISVIVTKSLKEDKDGKFKYGGLRVLILRG